jgi:cytochrome P450
MTFTKTASDYVSWLFFPRRFLFSQTPPRDHRVIGWETVRFVDSQDELQAVTKTTGDVFLGGEGNEFLEILFGPQSVFRLEHEQHQLARQISGGAMVRCAGADFTETIDRYIDDALETARSRRILALSQWSRELTMRAMCKLVLDIDDAATADRFFRRFEATTSYLANVVSYTKSMWRPRGLFSVGTVANHVVKGVDQAVFAVIRARKAAGAMGASPLDALIRGQETHGYDESFIRDNIVSLLAAGYETTGSAIAWMLYWLSRDGAYARVQARRAQGDADYVTAFRKESLRYCPPIEILPRKVAPDCQEAAARVLPDLAAHGSQKEAPMVCPFVHRVHHDASVHANPARFDPERFRGRTFRPTEYLPFGLGRRFCLGAAVGQRLMDRTLERLLAQGLRCDLLSSAFTPIRRNVTIWPGVFLFGRIRIAEPFVKGN